MTVHVHALHLPMAIVLWQCAQKAIILWLVKMEWIDNGSDAVTHEGLHLLWTRSNSAKG